MESDRLSESPEGPGPSPQHELISVVGNFKYKQEWCTISPEIALNLRSVWVSGTYPDDESVVERVQILYPDLDAREGYEFLKLNVTHSTWQQDRMDNVVAAYKINQRLSRESEERIGFVEHNVLNPLQELMAARVRGIMRESTEEQFDLKEASKIIGMAEKIEKIRRPKQTGTTAINLPKGVSSVSVGGVAAGYNTVELELEAGDDDGDEEPSGGDTIEKLG